MNYPTEIKDLLDAPIGIWGLGVTGRALVGLMEFLGLPYVVYDEKSNDAVIEEFSVESVAQHKLIVASPGFPRRHPWHSIAKDAGVEVLGELDFSSLFWQGRILAITGTNGKTTISSFLTVALKRASENAIEAGNIGIPLARLVSQGYHENAIAVCEVSSFQSESMKYFKPDAVIWTNFAEDHLDRHDSMDEYFIAKKNLLERLDEGGIAVLGESVLEYGDSHGLSFKQPIDVLTVPADWRSEIPDSVFRSGPQKENYYLVRRCWERLGYSESILKAAVSSYSLPSHRLQQIGEFQGVRYWNDSKATNFLATQRALDEFEEGVVWIGGGQPKGGDISRFVEQIAPKIQNAFVIGEVADQISKELKRLSIPVEHCESLMVAVQQAYSVAQNQSNIVFSPGFASFDQFSDYKQRGNSFINAFLSLKNYHTKSITPYST